VTSAWTVDRGRRREVNVIAGDVQRGRERWVAASAGAARWSEYARATAIVGATTALAFALRALLSVPDVEMLFLLGVLIAALTTGRRAALLASALAVGAYDFFFVPPAYTLDVSDARYLLTFVMMFVVSVVIGTLTLRLRQQRQAAVGRERRTSALYVLARELGGALDEQGVADVCAKAAAEAFDADVVFLRVRGRDDLAPLAAAPAGAEPSAADREVARWVVDHGAVAGHGTDALPAEAVLCAPVRAWGDVLAVLLLRPARGHALDAEHRSLLEALSRQAALALDRVRLVDQARQAALRARTEELRSGLLSSVSHDLRTPLAAITGAATTLRDGAALDPGTRADLAEAICEEAERLERLVANLLDMTRLDSGAVEPRREWVPLVEVIGGALTRLERRMSGRRVAVALPDDLPLVSLDPVLVEQLFINVLENAARYTPPGTEIELRAACDRGELRVDVADRGPGIPPGDEERVFERFHRGAHPAVRGAGLGLSIARAIAQVHGGALVAANRPNGGAVFSLTLPLSASPPPARPEPPPDGSGPEGIAGATGGGERSL
jgi:two-component system, OmpR family, sensor histidine kinase KdpD